MKFHNCKGGITLFLAIILMALLMLAGVFVDAARIAVAERKVQSSLNTAARSVLAGYDEELTGQFGLYGLDGKAGESGVKTDIFKYFQGNLKERHQGIKYINYSVKPSDITITTTGNLLSNEVYKRQILEYMKYKAPLKMTENMISKFKNAKMAQKLTFIDKEKNARNIGSNIKASLKKFNNTVKELGKTIGTAVISDLKSSLKESVRNNLDSGIDRLESLKNGHIAAKSHISPLDKEVDAYFNAKAESDKSAKAANAEPTLNEFTNTKNAKALIESVIDNNINEIDNAVSRLYIEKQQLELLKSQLKDLQEQEAIDPKEIENKQKEIDNKVQAIQIVIDNMILQQVEEMPVGEIPQGIEPEHKLDSENNKGFFEEIKSAFTNKLLLNSIKDTGGLISRDEFAKAAGEDRNEYGNLAESMNSINALSDEDTAETQNGNILKFMDKFQSLLSLTAENARDNMYITEYIMDKYTFATSQTERKHYFNKAEVEYILCGQDIEAENAASILASVWFLRFAVDSVDYFATSKIPHPVARLVWSLIEGATRAFKDIFDLYTTTEGCAICPSVQSVKISYSDHLRMFLLLKSEDTKLNRMRQLLQVDLMQVNKDFRLGNYETIIKVKVEVKVNLLFMTLLQLDKLNLKHFKGGQYVIKKEIVAGY